MRRKPSSLWRRLALAAGLAALPSCSAPPPDAYVSTGRAVEHQVSAGTNTAGEACTRAGDATGAIDIYCGTWVQPSGRLRAAGAGTDLRSLATASAWRAALDQRFSCGVPAETTILGGASAMVMQCTRRAGGWPHVALLARVGDAVWYGDGVLPVLPVMERSIGVLSGRLAPDATPVTSAADALFAARLAARAFGAGDVGEYEQLIAAGTRANLSDDAPRAEAAFRQALAVQERALGPGDANTVAPLTYLALQVSNQGRVQEADQLFQRAEGLVAGAADPVAQARLTHYRALHALNQDDLRGALRLLDAADAEYRVRLPPGALEARSAPPPSSRLTRGSSGILPDLVPARELVTDPVARSALLGLIEVWRYRGLVLRDLGRLTDSAVQLRAALDLARANDVTRPLLLARLYRTDAMTIAAGGRHASASDVLGRSLNAFARVLPDSKPVAVTLLVRGRQLALAGRGEAALAACREGVRILIGLKTGTDPDAVAGCLDVYAAAAAGRPEAGQALTAEMFAAAQLAQGGITSQQIGLATARLSQNARDPRIADAIRARQDAGNLLAERYRARDAAAQRGAPTAAEDAGIAEAQAALADAEQALQAAAPNYGQLVQQVVPAATVQQALRDGEAFVAMTLNKDAGWIFLVRRDRLAAARMSGGLAAMGRLVARLRAALETPGSPFDTEAAHALYTATLAGVAGDLAGISALTIAPDGPLLALPMDVLLTGPAPPGGLARAPWLLRRYSITHVPSAGNFVSLRRIAGGSRASRPWFGMGEFQPIPRALARRSFPSANCAASAELLAHLAPLPFAGQELEAARLLLGASPADELRGAGFTAAAIRAADLRDYRVLQFATHALLPSELACAAEPAIVTSAPRGATDAGGALLTASQIASLSLDAELVILSACNTGGPDGTVAGESLSGLARSFFYAGARALLVTHWAVNDQTAAFLVADTLRRLRANPRAGIAAALREAELAMLDGAGHGLNPAVAHPFYWAPFAVIGEGG
jgi:CHAT domain-containing protein